MPTRPGEQRAGAENDDDQGGDREDGDKPRVLLGDARAELQLERGLLWGGHL